MSDQINQIQATFNALEDRILLKFKTLNDHEYFAWVTRRFCKLLLPALHGLHPTTKEPLYERELTLQNDFQRQHQELIGDYSNPYETPKNPRYPLGETPVLLAKIRFQDLDSEMASFVLEPNKGQGLILPFHPDLMGPMLKIVNQALETAEWDLSKEMSTPESPLLQ